MDNCQESPSPSLPAPKTPLPHTLAAHFNQLFNHHPHLTPDHAFFLAAAQLHHEYLSKSRQVAQLEAEVALLREKSALRDDPGSLGRSKKKESGGGGEGSEGKVRIRRSAGEIARHYRCQVEGCSKAYGSEGSLNQHMKLKHRSQYTKKILMMGAANLPSPQS